MAEVKLKNGYLRISVSLFENLYFRNFSKRELLIISLILRLSYGYHKKTAIIKPKAWFSVCGLHKQDINKVLSGLVAKNVVKCLGDNVYSLNKNYDDWAVKFSKNYDANKLNILKMLQQNAQNTYEEVSETLTDEEVKNLPESKQNTYKEVSKKLTVSKTLTKEGVKNLPEKNSNAQNTYEEVSKTLTKEGVKNLPENAENEDGEKVLYGSKYNKDNKDITNNNIYNKSLNKNYDPYFNNPVVEKFKKEYERIFNAKRCYLDNFQINKLVEISIDNPDFIEKIPEILEKYHKIEFSNGISKFSLRGLIIDGKWAGILNGEYDQFIKTDTEESNEVQESWTL